MLAVENTLDLQKLFITNSTDFSFDKLLHVLCSMFTKVLRYHICLVFSINANIHTDNTIGMQDLLLWKSLTVILNQQTAFNS